MRSQTILSLFVILCFVLADLFAFALYQNPSSMLLWKLSLDFGHFFQPSLRLMDEYLSLGLLGNLAFFAACAAIPIIGLVRRTRILCAASCHICLALFAVTVLASHKGQAFATMLASTSEVGLPEASVLWGWDFQFVMWMLVTLVLACADAHLHYAGMIWRDVRSKRGGVAKASPAISAPAGVS